MKLNRENENYVYSFIGKNIKKYRKQKGWTQAKLAAEANYSKQFISNIENNTSRNALVNILSFGN